MDVARLADRRHWSAAQTALPRAAASQPPAAVRGHRALYERGIRYSGLHPIDRLMALTLSSLATWDTPTGRIPRRRCPSIAHMTAATGLHTGQTHNSLRTLQGTGWISRTDLTGAWPGNGRYSIDLHIPPDHTPPGTHP
jgi:hypothetical protein